MRLTLRTMLAYADDVLEAADQAEIGSKIEESENASLQLHRTRDLMRRTRIGAPPVMGRGFENDANSVAAYLDNGLDPQRVGEFETICLESDVHMAEAAACHQVLTLVLAEPATVEPASRQRMYRIPEQVAAAARTDVGPSPQPIAGGQVPDYIAESERARHRWILAAGLAATLLVIIVGLTALRPFWSPATEPAEAGLAATPAESPSVTEPAVSLPAEPAAAAPTPQSEVGRLPQVPSSPSGAQTEVARTEEPAPTATSLTPSLLPPTSSGDPNADSLLTPVPVESAPSDAAPQPPPASTDTPTESESPPQPPPAELPTSVGTFASEAAILCLWEKADWMRLPSPTALQAGDRLLALPAFSSSVALAGGIEAQLKGGARVTTAAAERASEIDGAAGTDSVVDALRIEWGRVAFSQAAPAPQTMHLLLEGHEPIITLADDQTVLAVEVTRSLPAGVDPVADSSRVQTRIQYYVAGGPAEWKWGAQQLTLSPQSQWEWTAGGLQPVDGENPTPAWIQQEQISDEEQRASMDLQKILSSDRPVSLSLLELSDHRRLEIRDLAARSALYAGQFEPILRTFMNPNQRIKRWDRDFAALRAALAEGPEVAEQIRESCLRVEGEQAGAQFYRLLWGYSAAQLEAGADAELVELLSHAELDRRVLALCNLRAITGRTGVTVSFRPERSLEARRRALPIWQQRLERGEIRPQTGP